ncbi:MAG TPA: hypothetical protein VLP43_03830 [Solirubrobacteraceae bacterium]|nr:hypothetical protein [Solirubrobacteraceae bacterium]
MRRDSSQASQGMGDDPVKGTLAGAPPAANPTAAETTPSIQDSADPAADTTAQATTPSIQDSAGELRVRVASPRAGAILRIVFIWWGAYSRSSSSGRCAGSFSCWRSPCSSRSPLFPLVDAIAVKTKVRRGFVVLFVYLILALLVALIGYVVIPSLVKELQMLPQRPALRGRASP